MWRWGAGLGGACAVIAIGVFACGADESDGATTPTGADASGEAKTTTPTDASTGSDETIIPAGPIDPAAAARAAVLLASCISDDGVNRTLQQLYLQRTTSPFRTPAILACLASKTNGCAAVSECLGLRYSTDGGCGSDGGCNGNVYEECSGADFRLSVDCTPLGLQCKTVKGAYCGEPSAVACEESTTVGVCDGTTPVGCVDGLMRRGHDCAKYGATCAVLSTFTNGGTTVGCQGAGADCTATSNDDVLTSRWIGVKCESGKLVGCLSGQLGSLDCAGSAIGFSCFDAPDGGPEATAYCGNAAECSPQSPWEKVAATCEGTSVVMCNGGKIDKLDCTSLGFTGCNSGVCTPGFL